MKYLPFRPFNRPTIVLFPLLLFYIASLFGAPMTGSMNKGILASLYHPPEGWKPSGFEAEFRSSNLHEYLNGGAERYLGYGCRELRVREYISDKALIHIMVEIYLMDSPANAYGIFSSDRAGGQDHDGYPGQDTALGDYLLQFWQGPYFVRVQDTDLAGGLRNDLLAFGKKLSAGMPGPSASDRPEIIALLPDPGLIESSVCYFHTRNSLNSLFYLGEENLLGLGPEVQAVSAEYKFESTGVARLIIVLYPEESACRAAFNSLVRAGPQLPEASRTQLAHTSILGNKLVLVLGTAEPGWITRLENELGR